MAAFCSVWLCTPVQAQQGSSRAQVKSEGKVKGSDERRLKLDLGTFDLREHQPTRNETTKINFKAYLVMSPEVSKREFKKLEHWKHRFRNQVITSVRVAEVKDFQEPELKRLRHIILLRIGRLTRKTTVEDVLFTEFTFSVE